MTNQPSLHQALDLLSQTQDQEKVDAGFESLLKIADSGDMTAAAYIGDASRFEHIGHYDLDRCKEYLEKSAGAGNPMGQYFLGAMLMCGEAPFQEDKFQGKWLLEEAKKAENEDAGRLLESLYKKMSTEDAVTMFKKSLRKLFWLDLWESIKKPFKL